MKAIPERLHIDELKRVEQQTNDLLKAWRKLNMDFSRLQEEFNQLTERHEYSVQQHAEQSTLQSEQARTALENLEAKWQARYDEDREAWQDEKQTLITTHEESQRALETRYQNVIDQLQTELQQVNARKNVLIDRIRGIEHE